MATAGRLTGYIHAYPYLAASSRIIPHAGYIYIHVIRLTVHCKHSNLRIKTLYGNTKLDERRKALPFQS